MSDVISTWGNEINGTDGSGKSASYVYIKTVSDEDLAQLDSNDSLNPTDPDTFTETPVYRAQNGVQLIDLRGKDYDDPLWEDLLDNLSPADYQKAITLSGYETSAIPAIGKPSAMDADTASGLYLRRHRGHVHGYAGAGPDLEFPACRGLRRDDRQ